MFDRLPLNRYQIRQIKGYLKIISITVFTSILLGNIITAIARDSVEVNENSYIVKEGFPLFKRGADYISLIKKYTYDPGVKLKIHRMKYGESYWDVAQVYNISIDTIIAANPFLNSLTAKEGIEIVIPAIDGVLLAFDDILDVGSMKKLLKYNGDVRGDYLPTLFKLISTDDIRLVFLKGAKPCIVNNSIGRLYKFKNIFQSPVNGRFSSLFGGRVDPISSCITKHHDGVDIIARTGTPIRPTREGMVIFTGWRGGYGRTIMIQHHDGYTTLYGHCSSINVKRGDWVYMDDIIGRVGSTGRSTGPHLHFSVMKHGRYLDPLLFIW